MKEKSPDSTRSTLIDKLKLSPDEAAWAEFDSTYRPLIRRVCLRWKLSPEDCEDVCQDVMLELVAKLPFEKFDSERGRFRHWLCQRVKWKILDWKRERKVDQMMEPLRGENDRSETDGKDMKTNDEDRAASELDELFRIESEKYWQELVLKAVKNKVRVTHYQVYEQLIVQEKSPQEVAEFFGLEVNHVYKIKHDVQAVVEQEKKRLQDRYD